MPEIIVTVKPNGETIVEGENFKGSGCKSATEFIEKALGKVASDKLKPEYYETAKLGESIKIR